METCQKITLTKKDENRKKARFVYLSEYFYNREHNDIYELFGYATLLSLVMNFKNLVTEFYCLGFSQE